MTLNQIKKFFAENEIPDSLDLSPHGHVFDLPKFVKSHIEILEGNPGNKAFMPYYHRIMLVVKTINNSCLIK